MQNHSVSDTIVRQIGQGVLMSLGARNFLHGDSSVNFQASILPFKANGERSVKPRVMVVSVTLNAQDLYDVSVGYMSRYLGTYKDIKHFEATDLFNTQLSNTLLALDWDGDEVLNPRLA